MALLLVVRFLAELGMLTCLAFGGWHLGGSPGTSLALALRLPVGAALVWGRWVAPRAGHRLPDPARLAVEVALFSVAFVVAGGAQPRPAVGVVGLVVWAGFLVSIPARGHEPVPLRRPERPEPLERPEPPEQPEQPEQPGRA